MSSVIGCATELSSHPLLPMEIFDFAWLEGILEAKIVKTDDHDAQGWDDFRRWTSGRLFGEKGEYRWQSTNNRIHAVFILDEGALPEVFQSIIIEKFEEDSSLILWGTWVNPGVDKKSNSTGGPIFYDRSLPRPQFYPLPVIDAQKKGMAPCLRVRRYRHKSSETNDNIGEFIRCVGFCMEPTSEEEG